MERQWIATFAAVGATSPAWFDIAADAGGWVIGDMVFDSMQAAQMFGHLGGGGDVTLADVGMPDIDMPNMGMPNVGRCGLQGMAEAMGGGLDAASGGLSGLLDMAGGIFDSIDFDW